MIKIVTEHNLWKRHRSREGKTFKDERFFVYPMHSYAAHMLWPSAERPDAGQSNKFCMLSERKTAKVFIRDQPHAIH